MKANEVILLALVLVVTVVVLDIWTMQRVNQEVKAILAVSAKGEEQPRLTVTGFSGGAIAT